MSQQEKKAITLPRFISYEVKSGQIRDEELIREDFRKAMLITALSALSAVALTAILYVL